MFPFCRADEVLTVFFDQPKTDYRFTPDMEYEYGANAHYKIWFYLESRQTLCGQRSTVLQLG